jgi:hypothetical protein
MSSITASERNNQSDEIRRIREEYEAKESDTTKKKNKEIKSLSEKQDAELNKIRDEYSNQVDTLRSKQSESLDERDRRHSDEISKIRDMYVESLKRKSQDEVKDRENEKEAFQNSIDKEKTIAEQQKASAVRGLRNALTEKDRLLTDRQERTTEQLQTSLRERAEKMNEKHKQELGAVTQDRDREVGDLRNTLDNVKSSYSDRLSAEERNHRADTDRREAAFENTYRNQEHNNAEMIAVRDSIMKEEKQHLNAKMSKRMDDETEKMTALRENFATGMEKRTGDMIRSANIEASQAKNDRILDSVANRRISDLQKEHLMTSYQQREDDLMRQRNGIYSQVNDKARERVNQVIERTDKLIGETGRRNRMEQDIEGMRTKEALTQAELLRKDQLDTANTRADQRVRKVVNSTNMAQKEESRQHMENVDELRHNYTGNLQAQREAQLESMNNIYSRMDQKLRDLEAHLMKKHDDAVEFYESKIDEIVSQNKKDTQRMNQNFEARMSQRDKAAKMEQDTITQKYEQKMALQEDVHQKDLNRLEKRHQEQMQSVAARAASAQTRKA